MLLQSLQIAPVPMQLNRYGPHGPAMLLRDSASTIPSPSAYSFVLLSLGYFKICCLPFPRCLMRRKGLIKLRTLLGLRSLLRGWRLDFPLHASLCISVLHIYGHGWLAHCFQSSQDLFSEKLGVFLPKLWSDIPPLTHRVHF